MTDLIDRAHWLEPHDKFEGVGAHELNPRYDHVDGGGFDTGLLVAPATMPALVRAQTLVSHLMAPQFAVESPRMDGMDGAHYQFDHGKPDLKVMHDAGLWWIGWKLSQSTGYVDPTFAEIRQEWSDFENRLPYHWLSSTTDPIAQADWYLKQLGELRPGEAVMLDIEEKGDTVEKALAFFERTEEYTHRPGVGYSGIYVTGGTIWKSPELRNSRYGKRPFIVAAYVTQTNLRARLAATHSPDPDAWQYGSDGGIPGVPGRGDKDMVFDKPAFSLACGTFQTPTPQPQPPQSEDDMTTNYLVNYTASPDHGPAYPDPDCSLWVLDDDGAKRLVVQPEKGARGWGDPKFMERMFIVPCVDGTLATIPDYVPGAGGTLDAGARAEINALAALVEKMRAGFKALGS